MPEIICNTSPIQYLYQLGLLEVIRTLVGRLILPPAVVAELAEGRSQGIDLPDPEALEWMKVRSPVSSTAAQLVTDLGPGETEVLMLGLESSDAIVVIDDGLARKLALTLGLRFTGTLGLLLDAKKSGLVVAVRPLLDRLDALRFRLAPRTRASVLNLAGECDQSPQLGID